MVRSQLRALPRPDHCPARSQTRKKDVLRDVVGGGGIPDDTGQVTDRLGFEAFEKLPEGICILLGDGGEEVFVGHLCPLATVPRKTGPRNTGTGCKREGRRGS